MPSTSSLGVPALTCRPPRSNPLARRERAFFCLRSTEPIYRADLPSRSTEPIYKPIFSKLNQRPLAALPCLKTYGPNLNRFWFVVREPCPRVRGPRSGTVNREQIPAPLGWKSFWPWLGSHFLTSKIPGPWTMAPGARPLVRVPWRVVCLP